MRTANLIITPTRDMSREEWLQFRSPLHHLKKLVTNTCNIVDHPDIVASIIDGLQNKYAYDYLLMVKDTDTFKHLELPTVGGSEIGCMMGLSKWKSVIELYFEKVGVKPYEDQDNQAMFWGRELEGQIAEKWQYWDGNPEGMIENFKAKNIIRKCRRLFAYVQNVKYPYLFVSLDRLINKNQNNIEGILECKTISGYYADMWEHGFPPDHLVQNIVQMGVCELNYGEIAIIKDGRNMDVIPFEFSPGIMENVIAKAAKFADDVKHGCINYLLSQVAPTEELKAMHLAIVDKLAPDPDGSVSYTDYLKKVYTDQGFTINGTDEHADWARKYELHRGLVEESATQQNLYKNKLIAAIGNAAKLDLGSDGYVSYKANAKGSRSFRVALK